MQIILSITQIPVHRVMATPTYLFSSPNPSWDCLYWPQFCMVSSNLFRT